MFKEWTFLEAAAYWMFGGIYILKLFNICYRITNTENCDDYIVIMTIWLTHIFLFLTFTKCSLCSLEASASQPLKV